MNAPRSATAGPSAPPAIGNPSRMGTFPIVARLVGLNPLVVGGRRKIMEETRQAAVAPIAFGRKIKFVPQACMRIASGRSFRIGEGLEEWHVKARKRRLLVRNVH
jgi:hypothetical protein